MKAVEPQEMLRSLRKANPSADKGELLTLFWEQLIDKASRGTLRAIVETYFNNVYASLFSASFARAMAARRSQKAAVERESAGFIERVKQIMLLDMVMPNGKRLRNCTREEVGCFEGWYGDIYNRLKPGQKVGGNLSESDVRSIYDQWAAKPKAA